MNLPPQAYTKETLIQAYNWLRSQPIHVQELAKSPDILVSLYSKAQIHGENYLSRTNIQTFKSELKNLANIMGDLEENTSSSTNSPQMQNSNFFGASGVPSGGQGVGNTSKQNPNSQAQRTTAATTPPTPTPMSMSPMITEASNLPIFSALATNAPTLEPDLKSLLDARSWGMVQEIKNHLNLSSETEALRLLIALGYQKIRPQF